MQNNITLYDLLYHEHKDDTPTLALWYTLLDCFSNIEREVEGTLRAEFNVELRRYDLLTTLAKHPHGLSMGQLASLLRVTNGTITGLISRLMKAGLVSKKYPASDKRTRIIKLTRKGRSRWVKMHACYESTIRELFQNMDSKGMKEITSELLDMQDKIISKRAFNL